MYKVERGEVGEGEKVRIAGRGCRVYEEFMIGLE